MAELSLKSLGKTYPGGVNAVSHVSIDIKDGEFIVLVGPSGCGKSTILRMIAGLETITSGDLHIDEKRVNDIEPGERDIAMVFQNYALYPHMTVRKNMEYGLKNVRMPKDEIARRIAEASRTLRLDEYLDRKPRQLSGGQRQRVAMGRAIVRDPKVFLFDEPLSNLDAKLRTQLRAELKDLHARLQATFIYVTHDQVEAMSLADRIIIMSEGRVEQIGTPMDLYHRPASLFVADFIGTPAMNLFSGALDPTQTKLELQDGVHITLPSSVSAPAGTGLSVGVRPEHLSFGHHSDFSLKTRVSFVEQLGADTIIHCHFGSKNVPVAMRVAGGDAPAPGQDVTISCASEHLHFFENATGQRME